MPSRLPLLALCAVLLLPGAYVIRQVSSWAQASPSASLPPFVGASLAHPATSITEQDLRGEPTLLNVWSSWCVACRTEIPLLMQIADASITPDEIADAGTGSVKPRLVALNHRDDPDDARRWLDWYGDPFDFHIVDPDGDIGRALDVRAVPTTLLLDADGRIRYRHEGPIDEALWQREFQSVLDAMAEEEGRST